MSDAKPPGPAGTPCPTCGHPAGVPPTLTEYRGGCIDPCHAAARAPAAPAEALFIEARDPVAFAIGEVVRVDYERSPVEHPGPWRWDDLDMVLKDAAGRDLLFADCGHCADLVMHTFASPRVRALTEAAPEMAELLRVLGDDTGRSVTNCHVTYPCSCERHRAQVLLARIDAAGEAGK